MNNTIVAVNAGSSSIKLTLFTAPNTAKPSAEAYIVNIGQPAASFTVKGGQKKQITVPDHGEAAKILVDWLKQQTAGSQIAAIGHRVVHGGPTYYKPQLITADLLAGLRELTVFDPLHMPIQITLIETFWALFPNTPHVACFDTAFHHNLPTAARLLAIPRRYEAKGVRRYGFHGLSYEYVMQEITRLDGADAAKGRLVLAHLGNGASLAAVQSGEPIDTTMGLTPASGIPMSTRSGDLDPGLGLYLAQTENLTAAAFNKLVNFESGLLGISETTSDMEQLLQQEATDVRAKEAADLFCYQTKKSIGSLAAALGGLDMLVFSGGMGEAAPKIRARVCDGLAFLGIELDATSNNAGEGVISSKNSKVTVRVVHTEESVTIAKYAQQLTKR